MCDKWVRPTELQRFWNFVSKTETCWLWQGSKDPSGYGTFRLKAGKVVKTHRYSFALHKGEIPTGLFVLHSCHTPSCVNPEHLRVGTHLENMQEAREAWRNRKLSLEQVDFIRKTSPKGTKSTKVANSFGVSRQLIADILAGRSYR